MADSDLIACYFPATGQTANLPRGYFRREAYFNGWRSVVDPYGEDSRMPGTELDFALLNFDAGTVNGNSAPIEFSSGLRITVPDLNQPIDLVFWGQLASVTSASTFSIGFCRVSELASLLGFKGLRQYVSVPTAAAAIGTPVALRVRLDAAFTGADWTIAGIRDSGTGSGQLRGNDLYSGGFGAYAA